MEKITEAELIQALNTFDSINQAANHLSSLHSMDARNLRRRLVKVQDKQQNAPEITPLRPLVDALPEDDLPVEEIIDLAVRRAQKRLESHIARRWMTIRIPVVGPFAVVWVGDPHLDSNGCNWPLLKEHIDLMANEEAVYAANVGDTLDNWPTSGRLAALYAHSDTSQQTGWKLAEWFLEGSKINWMLWLMGNHDLWNGANAVFKRLGAKKVFMEDWGARITLKPPQGREYRVWLSHNFPGHSMWNSMHGPGKAAKMSESADVYVCGHTHNWAIQTEEHAARGTVYDLVRARGYKYIDDHAEKLGYFPQQFGASVITVFNPEAETQDEQQQTFRSLRQGVEFLRYLRAK